MATVILTLFGDAYPVPESNTGGRSGKQQKATHRAGGKANSHGNDPALAEGKNYYSIGEVASIFGINTSHIRFWTKEFALKVRTTRKGDRLYTPEQVKMLRMIYHLVREQGFTLRGARNRLAANQKKQSGGIKLKQSLLILRNQLSILYDQLA